MSAGLHLPSGGVLQEQRVRREQWLLVQGFSTARSESKTGQSERLQRVDLHGSSENSTVASVSRVKHPQKVGEHQL